MDSRVDSRAPDLALAPPLTPAADTGVILPRHGVGSAPSLDASTIAPAANSAASLPQGPTSCRLAGTGPAEGTGRASAGSPARLTGIVWRKSSVASGSSRLGGKT